MTIFRIRYGIEAICNRALHSHLFAIKVDNECLCRCAYTYICDVTEEAHIEEPDVTEEPVVADVPVEPAAPSNIEPPRRSDQLRKLPSYLSDYVC